MIRVGMIGLGRTGAEIAKVLLQQKDMELVAAVAGPGSEKAGKDLGEILSCGTQGILVEDAEHLEQVLLRTFPDVMVDFSNPDASLRNARICSKWNVALVIGTTGFSQEALTKLYAIGSTRRNGIVYAPNITLGVNVLMLVTNLAASLLEGYDFQITETHHRYKKDAPSGTASKIAAEIEKGIAARSEGEEASASTPPSPSELMAPVIPIQSIRAGGVVGRHEVLIAGDEDQIQISHESFSRKIFGAGAVRAVHYIAKRKGYYEMSDVLDLQGVLARCLTTNCKTPPPIERRGKEPGVPSPSGKVVWSGF